jgi:hypothetical protein
MNYFYGLVDCDTSVSHDTLLPSSVFNTTISVFTSLLKNVQAGKLRVKEVKRPGREVNHGPPSRCFNGVDRHEFTLPEIRQSYTVKWLAIDGAVCKTETECLPL